MLRKLVTGAFCAGALFALAGHAQAQPLVASGDVSIAGQHTSWMTDPYGDYTAFGFDAYGRFMLPFGNGFSVQIDGAFETSDV